MKLLKKSAVLIICLLLVLCGCGEQAKVLPKAPDAKGMFDFTVLKSGQADAIVMKTEKHTVVIDVGEDDDGDEVLEHLSDMGVENIDYLFITHFDKDHVGGFPEVIRNVTASNIFVPDYVGNNDEYELYMDTVSDMGLEITTLTEDTTITIDDVLFEISVPKRKTYAEDDNDFSLVISATHGENTFLFAGDAEQARLSEVLKEFGRDYDFLKVPHHGKFNNNTKRFITTVKPEFSVITDSDKNPAPKKTTTLLEGAGSKVYSTRDGDVTVLSDGKEISVKQ